MKRKVSIAVIPDIGGGPWRYERCIPWFPQNIGFRVISLPGYGGQPLNPEFKTVEDFAAAIKERIVNLPGPRFLFGTGIGGSLVLQVIQDPDIQVDGVILHAPSGSHVQPLFFANAMKNVVTRKLLFKLMGTSVFRAHLRRKLFRQPIPDAFADQFFEEFRNCEAYHQMANIITPEWFSTLKPVTIPSVILWGGNEVKPSQERIDFCKSILPDAEVRYIKEWDYFPMIEQPRSFARELSTIAQEMVSTGKDKIKGSGDKVT